MIEGVRPPRAPPSVGGDGPHPDGLPFTSSALKVQDHDGGAMNRQSAEGAPEWEDAMSKVHSRYSRLARAVIAMFVFAVGMLGGAGVAALLMPT